MTTEAEPQPLERAIKGAVAPPPREAAVDRTVGRGP
jgi:hypothetical protein